MAFHQPKNQRIWSTGSQDMINFALYVIFGVTIIESTLVNSNKKNRVYAPEWGVMGACNWSTTSFFDFWQTRQLATVVQLQSVAVQSTCQSLHQFPTGLWNTTYTAHLHLGITASKGRGGWPHCWTKQSCHLTTCAKSSIPLNGGLEK